MLPFLEFSERHAVLSVILAHVSCINYIIAIKSLGIFPRVLVTGGEHEGFIDPILITAAAISEVLPGGVQGFASRGGADYKY